MIREGKSSAVNQMTASAAEVANSVSSTHTISADICIADAEDSITHLGEPLCLPD
jgi:hypothetical protein